MESYEKIRKMGEISEQLRKHGLAEDSTDALKKAESMIAKDGSEFYVTQEKMKQSVQKAQECCIDANKEVKQLQTHMNDRLAAMDSQISLIRDKMNEIIAKINEIESKVDSHPKQEVQATLSSAPRPAPAQERPENKITPQVKKEYRPEDVSVDKMFYTGKK